jgi:dTDP-4-amino-4,6-dideoxygalactose transaminase
VSGRDAPRVPTKDYARQYRELWPELGPALERAFFEDDPILGAATEAFERDFAAYLGVRHVVGVNSGTDALVLALRALRVGPGDEVVLNANAFVACVSAVVMVGARPVLVDPDPRTWSLTADAVRAALTPRTKAAMPVHLYGAVHGMPELAALCRERGIALVEDVAQAHGARGADGRRAGAYGRAGCFSFHPSKNLGAFGDGGALATDDDALAAEWRTLRNLGKTGKYDVARVATNTKLDTLQAVVLGLKLKRLDAWTARRRALAARYRAALAGIDGLVLPPDPGPESHVYHLFVVLTERRDALKDHLARRGIGSGLHYPIPPHLQPLDVDLGYPRGSLPVAERLAATCLTLPLSHEHTDAEIDAVADAVRGFFA